MYKNRQHECDWAKMKTFGKYISCMYGWTKCNAPQARGWVKLRCPYYWPPKVKHGEHNS